MLLVRLELLGRAVGRDRRVTARLGYGQAHGLVKQREAVDLVDGLLGARRRVEHDKRLALGLEVRLGDDVDDLAELGKDGAQGGRQGLGLGALLEVLDVDTVWWLAVSFWSLLHLRVGVQ